MLDMALIVEPALPLPGLRVHKLRLILFLCEAKSPVWTEQERLLEQELVLAEHDPFASTGPSPQHVIAEHALANT
jgi:hypothetical protein